jgi:hypothetical protein
LLRGLTTQLGAVNGDKKSRTDGDGAYVRHNGIKVKTDLFGKHASDALLWFLGVYYGKRNMQEQINRACFKRLALRRRVPVLMIERGTSSQQIAIIRKQGAGQYFEAPFLNAITPPTKAF